MDKSSQRFLTILFCLKSLEIMIKLCRYAVKIVRFSLIIVCASFFYFSCSHSFFACERMDECKGLFTSLHYICKSQQTNETFMKWVKGNPSPAVGPSLCCQEEREKIECSHQRNRFNHHYFRHLLILLIKKEINLKALWLPCSIHTFSNLANMGTQHFRYADFSINTYGTLLF